MKLKMEINLDNAAFQPESEGHEVSRIFGEFACRIDNCPCNIGDTYSMFDANGNRIGSIKISGN